jgi:hypothetical protein
MLLYSFLHSSNKDKYMYFYTVSGSETLTYGYTSTRRADGKHTRQSLEEWSTVKTASGSSENLV